MMLPFAGILTIPIAGVLGAVVLSLRGPLTFPLDEGSSWIDVVTAPNFLAYQTLLIVAYVLPFIGFLVLYERLRGDGPTTGIAFLGLVSTLAGTALALPSLGIVSFAMGNVGRLGAAEQAAVGRIVTDAVTGSGSWVGIAAAVLYTVGPMLFALAIWQRADRSRIAAVAFAAHGLALSFGFAVFPVLILGWLLLAFSGILLALDLWRSPAMA